MSLNQPVEWIELDPARKWEYLQRYYAAASRFYDVKDEVIDEAEVARVVANLKPKPAPRYRKEIPLTRWRYRLDDQEEGVRLGYFGFGCDDSAWEQVETPHTVNHIPPRPERFGRSMHDPFAFATNTASEDSGTIWKGEYAAWYRCELPVGDDLAERVAYLAFDSVNLESTVWVNENPVMLDHLGLFPFEMEVTEELRAAPTGRAQITLRAKATATNKPWMFYNGFTTAYLNPPFTAGKLKEDAIDEAWAGLAGAGWLRVLNRAHLRSAFFQTRALGEGEAEIACRVTVRNEGWERFKGKLQVEVSRWLPEEGAVERVIEQEVEVLPMNEGEVELVFRLEQPAVWEPGKAALYLGHVILVDEAGQPVDDVYETFGVRTVEMKGAHFYVNGRLTYLRGTHDVCHYPDTSAIAPTDEWIVRDLLFHFAMGANCSRYPSDMRIHYRRIAEICDQLGYMLVWCGYFEVFVPHPEFEMYAERDVPALVRDLRNHASIIIWEMGDEPLLGIYDYRRYRWYEQVYRLVESEDDTRPILPAGHFSLEQVNLIAGGHRPGQTLEERRREVLRDFPVYSMKKVFWDHHYTFMITPIQPVRRVIARIADALGGERPTVLTEFGIDGLPEPEKVFSVYGGFRWGANQYWYVDRERDDEILYGRQIRAEDWRETQACQAIELATMITGIRERPRDFAAFYFMEMFDVWTYYQGVVDVCSNPKLGFFVMQSLFRPLAVSGLHGNTVLSRGEPITVSVSNLGPRVDHLNLNAVLRDSHDFSVLEENVKIAFAAGPAALTDIARLETTGQAAGCYTLELVLTGADRREVARTLEIFYIQEKTV
ncbi:MAG: hypothetical protein B6D39_08005 [Anaerolineae bacterium UTCFX2]|jgi:hypothetical protein|nr:hypothetical protein [Anaerolineales bacterium]OQY90477.1 MAG: hypothetical protein B6D39_08005 [Anaerolineae bacterium UTCFX2]